MTCRHPRIRRKNPPLLPRCTRHCNQAHIRRILCSQNQVVGMCSHQSSGTKRFDRNCTPPCPYRQYTTCHRPRIRSVAITATVDTCAAYTTTVGKIIFSIIFSIMWAAVYIATNHIAIRIVGIIKYTRVIVPANVVAVVIPLLLFRAITTENGHIGPRKAAHNCRNNKLDLLFCGSGKVHTLAQIFVP